MLKLECKPIVLARFFFSLTRVDVRSEIIDFVADNEPTTRKEIFSYLFSLNVSDRDATSAFLDLIDDPIEEDRLLRFTEKNFVVLRDSEYD